MRVDQNLELPVFRIRQFRPKDLEIALNFGNVRANGSFRMPWAGFAPVEIALIPRIAHDRVVDLFVLAHLSCHLIEALAGPQRLIQVLSTLAVLFWHFHKGGSLVGVFSCNAASCGSDPWDGGLDGGIRRRTAAASRDDLGPQDRRANCRAAE